MSRSDLPYHTKLQQRSFPLPNNVFQEYYGEDLYDGTIQLNQEDQKRKEEMLRRLDSLCPENMLLLDSEILEDDAPSTNIRVRHVQPMAPGRHTACHNISTTDLDLQSKKSLTLLRRAFFEQTTKIFQNYKGSLVYDVMDDAMSRSFDKNDG
jgi:hypothetical protein